MKFDSQNHETNGNIQMYFLLFRDFECWNQFLGQEYSFVYLSVCLYVCLSVCITVCMSICFSTF
jgi:hypothetical protein